MGNKLYAEDWEAIILRDAYGMKPMDIEKETGISDSTISGITRAFRAVREKKWEMLKDLISKAAVSLQFVEWASSKLNIVLPRDIYEAWYERYPNKRPRKPEGAIEQPVKDQIFIDDVVEKKNEDTFFASLLQQMQVTNNQLKILINGMKEIYTAMRDVKYIKENNDKNTDLLCEQLQQLNAKARGDRKGTTMNMISRLSRYSKECLTERLDPDFAEAVQEIVATEQKNILKETHMKILDISEIEEVGLLKRDNPYDKVREEDVEMFWDSGAMAAELPNLENMSMQTEKNKYSKAIRKLAAKRKLNYNDIKLQVVKGTLYIVRPELIRIQRAGGK